MATFSENIPKKNTPYGTFNGDEVMATYHCSIKVGYAGKTMPHLDYIQGEGKYSDREDVLHKSSGNLPSSFETDNEFWRAVAKKDIRAYREIEFSLPNELPLEEQIKLTEEFIKEVIPNHTYSYAIHEVDSAVYGIKNPHVHLMFNERICDETVRDLPKDEYLKKRGVNNYGERYGGAIRDESWRGRGTTRKYYEVRKHLADKINEFYEKHNINERVSEKSLKDQNEEFRKQGNVEKMHPSEDVTRVPEKEFYANLDSIRRGVLNELSDEEIATLSSVVKKKINHEKARQLTAIGKKIISKTNEYTKPTQEDLVKTFQKEIKKFKKITQEYRSPFDTLYPAIEAYNTPEKVQQDNDNTENIYKNLAALSIVQEQLTASALTYISANEMAAELKYMEDRIDHALSRYAQTSAENIFENFINQATNGEYSKAKNYLEIQKTWASIHKNNPEKLKIITDKMDELKKEISIYREEFSKPCYQKQHDEFKNEIAKKMLELYEYKATIQKYRESIEKFSSPKVVKEKVEKRHKVNEKHKKQKETINKKYDEAVKDIKGKLDQSNKEKLKQKELIKILNQATKGEYGKILQKIRSKESILKYQEKMKMVDEIPKTKAELKVLLEKKSEIEKKYQTTTIEQIAKQKSEKVYIPYNMRKDPTAHYLHKIMNSRYASRKLKRSVKGLVNDLQARSTGAASVHIEEKDLDRGV